MNSVYKVIGLMSGTSLDGLDIAGVILTHSGKRWAYQIVACETVPYPDELRKKLSEAIHYSSEELVLLDLHLGNFFGESVNNFISKYSFRPDFISSHGHTVFHQPYNRLTVQIGSANCIHSKTKVPIVFDFRSLDVQLGGQGAPLVPVGDHFLFPEFDACLNLGGIANISYVKKNDRIAYDLSSFNIVLNHFSRFAGQSFDEGGAIARQGEINHELLNFLNGLKYYTLEPPKSLGIEEISKDILEPITSLNLAAQDILRTFTEHLTNIFSKAINALEIKKILVTGGGAYNSYFLELLTLRLENAEVVTPDKNIIEFKEAIVFALLGAIRIRGEENVFSSVTGAERNSCSGSIIGKLS